MLAHANAECRVPTRRFDARGVVAHLPGQHFVADQVTARGLTPARRGGYSAEGRLVYSIHTKGEYDDHEDKKLGPGWRALCGG